MDRLSGKIALITGASSGIGAAAGLALAQSGVRLVLAARRKERLDKLVEEIGKMGGQAIAIVGDVADEASADAMVKKAVNAFGGLDILINSAGVNDAGGLETLPLDKWRRVLEINLMGTIHTCKAALPHLKNGGGDIINISSTSGRRAAAAFAAYSTSKFALTGFTESLRQELGQSGVRVSIIEPGATETEIAESINDPKWRDAIRQHVTKVGVMQAEDIAQAIVFILSLHPRANVSQILIRPTIDTAPF